MKKKTAFLDLLQILTSWSDSIGVFVFGAEDGLLHHPKEYDPCYPELDPQQIFPVAGCPDEPQQGVQDVHYTHYHVELQTQSVELVYKQFTSRSSCSSSAGNQFTKMFYQKTFSFLFREVTDAWIACVTHSNVVTLILICFSDKNLMSQQWPAFLNNTVANVNHTFHWSASSFDSFKNQLSQLNTVFFLL